MFTRHGFWTAAMIALCAACGSKSDGGVQDRGSPGTDIAGQDLVTGQDRKTSDQECTPGPKAVGEPCTAASECATCECEDVEVVTKGQFRFCTSSCTNHNQCGGNEVCLYPTERACVLMCTTVSDCPPIYTRCSVETGTFKFCNVE